MKVLKDQKGFTLLELLIALVILAIGLLGLAGLHISAITGNVSGFKLSTASAVAQEQIEELKALDPSDADLGTGDHDDGNVVVQNITYNRSYNIQDDTPVSGTSTILYTVSWIEPRTGIDRNTNFFTRFIKE